MLTRITASRPVLMRIQLVLWTHYLAENPSFPLAHPTFYHNLHNASRRYIARYLLDLHRSQGALAFTHCLRHPICDIAIADEIAKIWHARHPDTPLRCTLLPTRLFRQSSTEIPPLLPYLFERYSPSPNDPNGYPLSRSVLSHNEALIRYLLSKGAHPGVRGGLAVQTAVKMKRLDLVKLLVEPPELSPSASAAAKDSGAAEKPAIKRQRHEDRYKVGSELVETAMKAGADDIVHYFIKDKGVMPPLRSIMSMGKS